MENELIELVNARKCLSDFSKAVSAEQRTKAFYFIENFKQTSPHILDIGFHLACSNESYELRHFGLQLVVHAIKYKWNDLSPNFKLEIKNKLVYLITFLNGPGIDPASSAAQLALPTYFKNSLCLAVIELVKREWPQNWPTLMDELYEISAKTSVQLNLVILIFKYIAEELILNDDSRLPNQRRKDMNQYLNANMDTIFEFMLKNLNATYESYKSDLLVLKSGEKPGPQTAEKCALVETCLDCLSNYVDWININCVLSHNYFLINILLELLKRGESNSEEDDKLCIAASKCLIQILNRKGNTDERVPLLGLFSEFCLNQIFSCIQVSLGKSSQTSTNAHMKIKYLVQILIGMGMQLNSLWLKEDFEPPAQLSIYLSAIYEFTISENKIYSYEALQLWNNLLGNKFIIGHPSIKEFLINLANNLPNTYLLFRITSKNMINLMANLLSTEEFDSDEEEVQKFFQKYSTELGTFIKKAAGLYLQPYLTTAFDWVVRILNETNALVNQDRLDGSCYDSSSYLYLNWDALLYLWSNLMQLIGRKIKAGAFADEAEKLFIKEKLVALLNAIVKLNTANAYYCSFNTSLMSSIMVTSELIDDASQAGKANEREMLLNAIFEKLINEFLYFKSESNKIMSNQVKVEPAALTPVVAKAFSNVRRQLVANISNLCKSFSRNLKNSFTPIYNKISDLINSTAHELNQLEKSILIQSLIFLSNEFNSFEMQAKFIEQYVSPISEYFKANQHHMKCDNIDAFIQFIGLNFKEGNENDPGFANQIATPNSPLENRKQIFFYVNILTAVLKSTQVPFMAQLTDPSQLDSSDYLKLKEWGYVDPMTNAVRSPAFSSYIGLFEHLIDLVKCFNQLHAPALRDKVNTSYLEMTESAKALALGSVHNLQQQKQIKSVETTISNNGDNGETVSGISTNDPYKLLMFVYTVYDNLNQLIAMYFGKFSSELLFAKTNEVNVEFIYKLGDALFNNFNELPDFRLRLIIKYVLKSCLSSCDITKVMIDNQLFIVKLNEILLQYFLPAILNRIGEKNKHFSELNALNSAEDREFYGQNNTSGNKEQIKSQIIDENEFTLLCRDVVDLIKSFFNFTNPNAGKPAGKSGPGAVEMDENGGDLNADNFENIEKTPEKNSSGGAKTATTTTVVSELAPFLLRTNQSIYQAMLLLLFEGLYWPDSNCCARLVRIVIQFIEKFQVVNLSQLAEYSQQFPGEFFIYLNEQVSEKVFNCCLNALQVHGEHSEISSLLLNLAYLVYDKFPLAFKEVFNRVMAGIPNVNAKLMEDFVQKVQKSLMLSASLTPANTAANPQLQASFSGNERLKKDLFKKVLQPIIGKSVGQLYSSEIKIRLLQPLNIKTKRIESKLHETQANEFNICSLFDPANK